MTKTTGANVWLRTFLILAVVSACGANIRQIAERSVEISYHTLKSAETTYHVINENAQTSIVDNAKSGQEGAEKLATHREKADKVYKAFAIAYTTLGAASTAIAFADISKLDQAELIRLILDAKTAVENVIRLIKDG